MKMLFTYPVFLFVVLFAVACGKQDSSDVAGTAVAPAPVAPAPATPYPVVPGTDLASFCYSRLGVMEAADTICVLAEKDIYGGGKMSGTVALRQVYANEEITVITSHSPRPRIYIGDGISPNFEVPANSTFVAPKSGQLLASGNGWDMYRVSKVHVRRCVNASFQIVACP